jgi:hypothetical protein
VWLSGQARRAEQGSGDRAGVGAAWGGDSRSAPHSFANLKVTSDLSRSIFGSATPVTDEQRWRAVPVIEINRAASALLKANTEKLVALGAATVSRAL